MVPWRQVAALLLSGILVGLLALLASGTVSAGFFWIAVLAIAIVTIVVFPQRR